MPSFGGIKTNKNFFIPIYLISFELKLGIILNLSHTHSSDNSYLGDDKGLKDVHLPDVALDGLSVDEREGRLKQVVYDVLFIDGSCQQPTLKPTSVYG